MSFKETRPKELEALKDPRVIAIHADPLVGKGTCSSIDECMEASELVERLNYLKITEPVEAVKEMREHELQWREQGTNASSGEPGCELVKSYNDFKQAMEQNPL